MTLDWFESYSRSAPGNANKTLALFRQILNHAIACGHIEANPMRGIACNPRRKITRFLSREEISPAISTPSTVVATAMPPSIASSSRFSRLVSNSIIGIPIVPVPPSSCSRQVSPSGADNHGLQSTTPDHPQRHRPHAPCGHPRGAHTSPEASRAGPHHPHPRSEAGSGRDPAPDRDVETHRRARVGPFPRRGGGRAAAGPAAPGGTPPVPADTVRARIALALSPPPPHRTHWTPMM